MFTSRRVRRGVALLDARKPDWWRHIDTDTLDVSSTEKCVLGQVSGSFMQGCKELDIWSFAASREHGFSAYTDRGLRRLTKQWRKIIKARRDLDFHRQYSWMNDTRTFVGVAEERERVLVGQ